MPADEPKAVVIWVVQIYLAAFAEILRYLIPIALILWLSFSKRAAEYLSASAGSNNSPQVDARNARA